MNINIKEITESIIKYLVENAVSKLDAETIQKALLFGIGKLKTLAEGTKTEVDDWAIGELEIYIQDVSKIEQIRSFIIEKMNHICGSGVSKIDESEYEKLADSLIECHDGCCGTPIGNRMIARILAMIITSILQYFTNKDN